jgi:D-alanyl-D-alanine-carboxypeptidase/D-alanyl-D-alanine-endopeptidase
MKALWISVLCGITMWAQGTDLRALLVNRVDEAKRGTGMVVGELTPEGLVFTAHGRIAPGGEAPGAGTLFEIGSITKVFTALLLMDMVERGEVGLDDPVAKYLPETVKVPSRNGRQITLADLTTHTSGLPRIPSNLDATNLDNPYAKYGPAELYAFLGGSTGYTLPRDPGAQWEYSNLGVGLLGHALALRAGLSYEALLRQRILDPLGLENTTITLSATQRRLMATAHDEELRPVSWWDLDALAGAGAIRSTAGDMLTFAAAAMGGEGPLKAAFARMLALRRPGQGAAQQAAGWIVMKPGGVELLLHDGGTHGFRSALALDPATKRAAVVWINGPTDVTDVAIHALVPAVPVLNLSPPRREVMLSEAALEQYVGNYPLAPTFVLAIKRSGQKLSAQATGQPAFEIFAEKPDEFFAKVTDLQISFTRGESGAVTGLVLHQLGRHTPAPKQP